MEGNRVSRSIILAHFKALVKKFGCQDSIVSLINTTWGSGGSTSNLSKKLNGSLDISVVDAITVEDAVNRYPITEMMARRRENRTTTTDGSLTTHTGIASKEFGEAIAATMRAEESSYGGHISEAIAEAYEARDAMDGLIESLEQQVTHLKAAS